MTPSHYIEANVSQTDDVYVAISTQVEPPEGRKRGGAETVSSLTGLFADIDFADAKGEQTGYPKNEEEAIWIFSRGFRSTDLDRSTAETASRLISISIRPLAAPTRPPTGLGGELSATTFQRALRRPLPRARTQDRQRRRHSPQLPAAGTLNHKSDPPKAVRLLEHDPVDGTRSNRFGNFLERARSARRGGQSPPRRRRIMRRSSRNAPGIAPSSSRARRPAGARLVRRRVDRRAVQERRSGVSRVQPQTPRLQRAGGARQVSPGGQEQRAANVRERRG